MCTCRLDTHFVVFIDVTGARSETTPLPTNPNELNLRFQLRLFPKQLQNDMLGVPPLAPQADFAQRLQKTDYDVSSGLLLPG